MIGNYLDDLKKSARETLAEPRVRKFMDRILNHGAELPIDLIINELEKHMREYSTNWAAVAAKHEASGLYKRISEFCGQRQGLYVDFGCGAGNLLSDLPSELKLIGADINPYLLQIAQENLKKANKKVERHSNISMGFLPDKGLVVRPLPLMEELDFKKVQLISDDITDMNNTKRVLYYQGIKADGAFFTLAGGHSVQRAGELISFLKYRHTGKDDGQVKSLEDVVGPFLRNVPAVVKKGGHVYLAIRALFISDDSNVGADMVREYVEQKYGDSFRFVRETNTPLINERGHNGISINSMLHGNSIMSPQVTEKLADIPYQLNLAELIVK